MLGKESNLKFSLLAAAIISVGGCSRSGEIYVDASSSPKKHHVDAAMAATFRLLFVENASGLQGSAAAYCIGIGPSANVADPNKFVITSLSDVKPMVVPASSCRQGSSVVNGAGQASLFFHLSVVNCDTADDCLLNGGYYEGNLSASGGDYRARYLNGRWQVVAEGPQAIS